MSFDVYIWKSPRELDGETVEALVRGWHEASGDPAQSPFEPSTDVGWFVRELVQDEPEVEVTSDAVPSSSKAPIWLATTSEAPARVAALRLQREHRHEQLDTILGLAAKYDLLLFDPSAGRVVLPLHEMAAHASATFWPAGAIRAFLAGAAGLFLAIVGWVIGVPVLGWLLVLVGGFLFVMAVFTFAHEGMQTLRRRASRRAPGDD